MKIIRHPLPLTPSYPLSTLSPMDKLLFFDIETTGFSASVSTVYLIGCIYHTPNNHTWNLIQWFADTPDDEAQILTSFLSFLPPYSTLIHYNGTGFDLPFLTKRCRFHRLPCDLSQITSIDLYRLIRPYQSLLSLSSLKQKAAEHALGIRRTDPYTGKQLIVLYEHYQQAPETTLCQPLLLHNQEDLTGMFALLPLLHYRSMFDHPVRLTAQEILRSEDPPILELTCTLSCHVPLPCRFTLPCAAVCLSGSQLTCRIPLYEGEQKYFYPDYKNYYYLPLEDMAIHKSVGSYVAKEARQKATARTCYTRKSGLFLIQPEPLWQPLFQSDYQSRPFYALYQERLFDDEAILRRYLNHLFLLAAHPSEAAPDRS